MLMLAPLLLVVAPLVGPEVTWRVTSAEPTYFPAQQAAPVAADGAGYAAAWSEVAGGISRACAGTLTASGHIDRVGVCTSGTADASAIVPFGDGYVAAWLEPEPGDARPNLVTGALDRDFHLRDSQAAGLAASAPEFHAGASRLWLFTTDSLYELDAAGAVLSSTRLNDRPEELTVSGDQIGYVSHSREPALFRSPGHGLVKWVYSVQFTRFGGAASLFQFGADDPDVVVGTGANDAGFLVLWTQWGGLAASFFGPGFARQVFVSTSVPSTISPPQVAWDGTRWVAVWSDTMGVHAAAITPNLEATSFEIAAGGGRPAIVTSSPGRFLVTYEVVAFGQRRLVSRVIDFNPPSPRMRVVR
jgi:hypothetical protein